jgi:hypothetical protein
VSKNSLILVSLVGAIPGALLVGLMALAFLSYAGGPTMWVKALAVVSLLIGLLLTAMPVGIFVFAGPKAEKAPKEKSGDEAGSESSDSQAVIAESDDAVDSRSGATDSSLEVVEGEPDEFAMTGEVVADEQHDTSSEEFDVGSDFEIGTGDEEPVEAIEEGDDFDEEAPPKKKK